MRSIRTLILMSAFVSAPALAQMYPGEGITVNPSAIGQVPYRTGTGIIHLHMPYQHTVHHKKAVAATAAPTTAPSIPTDTASADTTTAPPPPVPSKHRKKEIPAQTAAVAPPPPAPTANVASGTGMDDAIPFSLDGTTPAAKPAPPKPAPQKQAAKAPPPEQTKIASAEPPQASTPSDAGMTKRGEILFPKSATDPAPAQFDGLKLLAGDLSEALKSGTARVQLQAYGGKAGDKGSDARRLSLKRALSIRQVLIDNGVPSDVIDVRAMGGADDKGPTDRVDVYIRAG
jgi:outer membrane protein OmpA-like peptidoglycan-associated protein